jgi:hypothetical protein
MTLPRQTTTRHVAPSATAPYAAFDLLVERLHGTDEHVRPAALRELGSLADTQPDLRDAVIGVICAFLRSPWTIRARELGRDRRQDPPAAGPGGRLPGRQRGRHGRQPVLQEGVGADSREPELRRAAVALLADHLRNPDSATTWVGADLDLAGAVLVGADFSGCSFTGGRVRFEGAWCIEGRMSLAGARFLGAEVSFRHWTSGQGRLGFEGARFCAGVVTLAGASLDADSLSLAGAVVEGGVFALTEARLQAGVVDLTGINVTSGTLSFADARLAGGRMLLVDARLMGGLTALRHVRLAPGVLSIAGAQALPGALDLHGTRVEDGVEGDALLRLAGGPEFGSGSGAGSDRA